MASYKITGAGASVSIPSLEAAQAAVASARSRLTDTQDRLKDMAANRRATIVTLLKAQGVDVKDSQAVDAQADKDGNVTIYVDEAPPAPVKAVSTNDRVKDWTDRVAKRQAADEAARQANADRIAAARAARAGTFTAPANVAKPANG